MRNILILLSLLSSSFFAKAQECPLIGNIEGRNNISLDGEWKVIIDPYENGYYDYRYQERPNGYFLDENPGTSNKLVEYSFDKSEHLHVPGDWNSQDKKLELYEGTLWYRKKFDVPLQSSKRYILWFGAVNYEAIVYLNGVKIGSHEGGFTPFNFEVTGKLKEKGNSLIVKVDNKRKKDGVPTVNTDWWNYGGITRDAYVTEVPETFIEDYFIQLKKGSLNVVEGWVKLNGNSIQDKVRIQIPEIRFSREFTPDPTGKVTFSFTKDLKLWFPSNPKMYEVVVSTSSDQVSEEIGFRSILTKGHDILLNGIPVYLKGVSIHEEAPYRGGRANGKDDASVLLNWAKEMGCNYVRLAHYPHNEAMVRMADKLGLMVWSEIPVYWTIQFEKDSVFSNAQRQLTEMITRDKNRASVIIWSMANETPRKESRNHFIKKLIETTRELDPTRLVSAALEINHPDGNTMVLDDPLGQYLDVLGCNEYVGWYTGTIESCSTKVWRTVYDKPLVISEFGAEAQFNLHGEQEDRWTEENQEYFYQSQLYMLEKITFLRGMSPWVLVDFRSPRRHLPGIQDFYNRKGLMSDKGEKKKAFFVMKKFYDSHSSVVIAPPHSHH